MNPRLLATCLAATLALPVLHGCFPVIAGGVIAGALVADDRRTLGAQTEDKAIFTKAESRVNERFGNRVHVNVTPFNRRVLLTGEVPDAATRTEVESFPDEVRQNRRPRAAAVVDSGPARKNHGGR